MPMATPPVGRLAELKVEIKRRIGRQRAVLIDVGRRCRRRSASPSVCCCWSGKADRKRVLVVIACFQSVEAQAEAAAQHQLACIVQPDSKQSQIPARSCPSVHPLAVASDTMARLVNVCRPLPRFTRGLLPFFSVMPAKYSQRKPRLTVRFGLDLPVVLHKDGRNVLPVIFPRVGGNAGERIGARERSRSGARRSGSPSSC